MLGIFFPPKEDEWMASWAGALAEENAYDNIQMFYERNMGYDPGHNKNFGYLRNLDHVCDRYGLDVFSVLKNNTDLYVSGAFCSYGTLACNSDKIFRDPKKMFLMQPPMRYLEGWRRCPECEKEDEKKYGRKIIHTKHQLHGVAACWKHGVRLVMETGADTIMAENEEVRYAVFLSDLFEKPLECSIQEIKKAIYVRLAEMGYKDAKQELPEEFGFNARNSVTKFFKKRCGYNPESFEKMVILLIRLFGDVDELRNYIRAEARDELTRLFTREVEKSGNVEILQTEFSFARLRCLICGQEFTVHMKAYLFGTWCPSCCNTDTEEDLLKRRIQLIGNGEYEYIGMGSSNSWIEVRHLVCGTVTKQYKDRFIWNHKGCSTCQNMAKHRIGMKNRSKNGVEYTITAYRNANDMDVTGDNGVKLEHVAYEYFADGSLGCKKGGKLADYHVGEVFVNKQGKIGKIIAWRRYEHIDVKFENGYIAKDRSYHEVIKGTIQCKKDRLGERNIHKCGCGMEIIRYGSVHDVDVLFDDGHIVEHVSYRSFKNGSMPYPGYHPRKKNRVGERYMQKNGSEVEIIEYRSSKDCLVRFVDDGVLRDHVTVQNIMKGEVGRRLCHRLSESMFEVR